MTDLISRADAIEALRGLFDMRKSRAKVIVECFGQLLNALPSAEYSKPLQTTLNGDLVSRTDAIEAVQKVCETIDKPCTDCTFFYDGCLAEKQIKALPSADAEQGYTEWLEKIIIDNEGANEWLCEDTPDLGWCEDRCHYSSIQAECLRHLYEVSKGGDDE